MERKASFAPVARADARLLILGSLPGEASLAAQRYYAHPTNQFWALAGAVIGRELAFLPYEARLAALQHGGIALWDVVASATRRGSLDTAIRQIEGNRLGELVAGLPRLRAVGFNGGTAARIGRRLLGGTRVALIDLPSSSAAHTRPFKEKAEAWSGLAQFVATNQSGSHDSRR